MCPCNNIVSVSLYIYILDTKYLHFTSATARLRSGSPHNALHFTSIVRGVDRKRNARQIRKLIKINPRNGCNGVNYDVCILRGIENGNV